MIDQLRDALRRAKADYADVRFETDDSTTIAYRGSEVEQASSGKYTGGIVRACTEGGWGVAAFDSPQDLPYQLEQACQAAKLVGKETTQLAQAQGPDGADCPAVLERDFRSVKLDEKLALIARYNEILLKAAPKIETTFVQYRDLFRTIHFASSRGASYREERPLIICTMMAVARDGKLVQRAHDSRSSVSTYDAVTGLEGMAEETSRRAAALLKARPCEGGRYTVILDPELAGVFAHEAFGHLSEADFLYENPKMRELMHLGRPIGVKGLNIVDDGSMPGLPGTQRFDDEGTPTRKTYLIREGVLRGHLHSLETAGKMAAEPTGNARAIARGNPPIVRMTNTYIEGGSQSFEQLLSGVDRGLYARGMFGGQTMMEMFTFSSAYGYKIENGKVGELVRDVVLTGNVFQTLHSIDGFGNDFQMIRRGGGCGKGGQSPLPVSFGAPHLRLREVLVGGQ